MKNAGEKRREKKKKTEAFFFCGASGGPARGGNPGRGRFERGDYGWWCGTRKQTGVGVATRLGEAGEATFGVEKPSTRRS